VRRGKILGEGEDEGDFLTIHYSRLTTHGIYRIDFKGGCKG